MTIKNCQCLLKHPVQNNCVCMYIYTSYTEITKPCFWDTLYKNCAHLIHGNQAKIKTHVFRHPVQKTNLMAIFLLSPKTEKLTETPCFWDTLYRKNSSIFHFHWNIYTGKYDKTYIFSETLHRKQNLISMFIKTP